MSYSNSREVGNTKRAVCYHLTVCDFEGAAPKTCALRPFERIRPKSTHDAKFCYTGGSEILTRKIELCGKGALYGRGNFFNVYILDCCKMDVLWGVVAERSQDMLEIDVWGIRLTDSLIKHDPMLLAVQHFQS